MSSSTTTQQVRVEVEISEDRLGAYLLISGDKGLHLPPESQLLELLGQHEILIDDAVRERLAALRSVVESDEGLPDRYLVAAGTPPFDGEDERFEWGEDLVSQGRAEESEGAVDFYSFNHIVTVEKGAVIGSIRAPVPCQAGVDVLGKEIPPRRQPILLSLNETVVRSQEDSSVVIAQRAGRVACSDGRLWISEVLELSGDVDFSTGHVDSLIDVYVCGIVRDRFKVTSRESVFVGEAIEAAAVTAVGDVVVQGGVVARNGGLVRAGRNITAKFGNEANFAAGGDICVSKQLMNCRVHADGKLLAEQGAIIGGCIYARKGVWAKAIGSEVNVPTTLYLGAHPRVLREAEEIDRGTEAKLKAVEKIRTAVQPLLANLKRLSPAQKEQATELMFKADELEMQVKDEKRRQDELLVQGGACDTPRVIVQDIVYPGVTISLNQRITKIRKELRGPISIEIRPVNKVTEFVAVNQLTGSITALSSWKATVEELLENCEDPALDVTNEVVDGAEEAAS